MKAPVCSSCEATAVSEPSSAPRSTRAYSSAPPTAPSPARQTSVFVTAAKWIQQHSVYKDQSVSVQPCSPSVWGGVLCLKGSSLRPPAHQTPQTSAQSACPALQPAASARPSQDARRCLRKCTTWCLLSMSYQRGAGVGVGDEEQGCEKSHTFTKHEIDQTPQQDRYSSPCHTQPGKLALTSSAHLKLYISPGDHALDKENILFFPLKDIVMDYERHSCPERGSQDPHALLTSWRGSSWRSPGAARTPAAGICSPRRCFPARPRPAAWPGSLPRVRALSLDTAPPTARPGSPSPAPPPSWLHSQSVENQSEDLSSPIKPGIAQTACTNCISAWLWPHPHSVMHIIQHMVCMWAATL